MTAFTLDAGALIAADRGDVRFWDFSRKVEDRFEVVTIPTAVLGSGHIFDITAGGFLRRFKQRYHVTPHQMVMAVRLLRAKHQLAAGVSPAHVAVDVGLVDQPHLTRRFARMYGVTPARYQAQLRTRPLPRT